MNVHVAAGGWPALVLYADFRPRSSYPLSLWAWQDGFKAVFLEKVARSGATLVATKRPQRSLEQVFLEVTSEAAK